MTRHIHPSRQGSCTTWLLALMLVLTAGAFSSGSAQAEQAHDVAQSGSYDELQSYGPAQGLSGRVTISGSTTMQPLMTKLAASFMSFHQNTKFGVEGLSSGDAIREFLLGIASQRRGDKARDKGTAGASTTELLASSRPLTDQEIKAFVGNYGYEPVALPVAMDAVAIYVHKDNPLENLTLDQVDAIFSSTRKRSRGADLTTWGQLGLQEGWAQQPIHLFGRNKKSGTRDFFKHVALMDGEFKDNVQEQPGSASEILAIAQDPLAIGYAGIGFHSSMVRIVPLLVQAGGAPSLPNGETVTSGQYPMARPLFLYVNKNPKRKLDPVVEEFLKFVNSRQGQETVARASFYPLTPAQVSRNLERLGHDVVVARNGSE